MVPFKAWLSTVNPFQPRGSLLPVRLLLDPITGAPTGIQNPNANGADGIWTPIDITAEQVDEPPAGMLADINATYRLNVAPFTRYRSNGVDALVAEGGASPDGSTFPGAVLKTVPEGAPLLTIGPNSYAEVYEPFSVQSTAGVSVQGLLVVKAAPA